MTVHANAPSIPLLPKRMFDIAVSGSLLVALALPLALIAMLVALDLRSSPIFRQERIGWKGRHFTIFKLRSMRDGGRPVDATGGAEVPFLYVPRDDPRITALGKFVRRYSIDEVPQLVNVLRGDMSLIGPRPFDVGDFAQARFPDPRYDEWVQKRHCTRPGMSGLWQVSGRNATSFSELIALDLRYVTDWTPGLELAILLRTFRAVTDGTGAC